MLNWPGCIHTTVPVSPVSSASVRKTDAYAQVWVKRQSRIHAAFTKCIGTTGLPCPFSGAAHNIDSPDLTHTYVMSYISFHASQHLPGRLLTDVRAFCFLPWNHWQTALFKIRPLLSTVLAVSRKRRVPSHVPTLLRIHLLQVRVLP